ncbi:MAG: hypothetical protein Q4B28_04385 [bacterium]|nr:hypothetical protein [bacterium]
METVFEQIISRTLQKGWKAIVLTSHYDPQLPCEELQGNLHIFRSGTSRR